MYGDMLYTFNCFEKLLIVPFILVFLAVINVEFPFCAPCVCVCVAIVAAATAAGVSAPRRGGRGHIGCGRSQV